MPPKVRFDATRILDAALALTKAEGIDAVTARGVAASLGCSTAPLFTQFSSMDDLVEQLMERIMGIFVDWAGAEEHADPLVAAGVGWLRFAAEEPRLYEAVFLRRHPWHAKWGPIRRRLAGRMAEHPRYEGLDDTARFALVGRASIVLHGLGVEIWSGRLPDRDLERLIRELAIPVVDGALAHGWTTDLHRPPHRSRRA